MVSLSIKRVTASTLLKRMTAEVTQRDRNNQQEESLKRGTAGERHPSFVFKCLASHRVSAIIAVPGSRSLFPSPSAMPFYQSLPCSTSRTGRFFVSVGERYMHQGVQKCCWWPAYSDTNHQMASLFACSVALGQAPMQVQPTRPGATRLGR